MKAQIVVEVELEEFNDIDPCDFLTSSLKNGGYSGKVSFWHEEAQYSYPLVGNNYEAVTFYTEIRHKTPPLEIVYL
jgi:hypothetical protein